MKPTIDNLKGTFTLSYDTYLDSRIKADKIMSMFEGNQYCDEQLEELARAGRPAEIFNVIRMFTRQLMGYYSTVYNTVEVKPEQPEDVVTASLLNDTIAQIDKENMTIAINEQLRLDCFISGLMVHYIEAVPKLDVKGEKVTDRFGRVVYKIKKTAIKAKEILLDPMSTEVDYSDARFIHRYKWLTKEVAEEMFSKDKISKLSANNEVVANASFDPRAPFNNSYIDNDNYLIIHTIMKDKKKSWSVYWSGDVILSKKQITHSEVKMPYQVVKLQDTYDAKYYGIFEDVYQSQLAINQALLQIQLMTNSNKVVVRKGAVADEDWEEFKSAIIRVNSVLELDDPEDVRILNMSGEIGQQYLVIDKAFDRIQRVLGINDSFLGIAYASDSGRKVKLQQNATIMALRYLDVKLQLMYKLIGWDEVSLIKQYFRAEQLMLVTDKNTQDKWIALNKPMVNPLTGTFEFHPEVDPETGEFAKDEFGNYILTPLTDPDTDLEFTNVNIDLVSVAYNDEDEKNQLMLETLLNGPLGQTLLQLNPQGYMAAGAKIVGGMKSKASEDIKKIFEQTAGLTAPQQPNSVPDSGQPGFNQVPKSQGLKLPQNTNEGV